MAYIAASSVRKTTEPRARPAPHCFKTGYSEIAMPTLAPAATSWSSAPLASRLALVPTRVRRSGSFTIGPDSAVPARLAAVAMMNSTPALRAVLRFDSMLLSSRLIPSLGPETRSGTFSVPHRPAPSRPRTERHRPSIHTNVPCQRCGSCCGASAVRQAAWIEPPFRGGGSGLIHESGAG